MQRDQDIAVLSEFTESLFSVDTDDFNRVRVAIGLLVAAQIIIGSDISDRQTFASALRATIDDLESGEARTIN